MKTIHDIQKFLGFFGYFRSHILNFARISQPLVELTKGIKYLPKSKFGLPTRQPDLQRSIEHLWTDQCNIAKNEHISALTSAPILKFPDSSSPYV